MLRSLHTILLVLCCSYHAVAQQPVDAAMDSSRQSTVQNDEEDISLKPDIFGDTSLYIRTIELSPDSVNAWKQDKDLVYLQQLDSLLRLKKQQELASAAGALRNRNPSLLQRLLSSGWVQGLLWVVAIAFVLLIVYRLFLNNGIFSRSVKAPPVVETGEETILSFNADYNLLIGQSLAQGNYRMAVRYQFLKTLQRLFDKGQLQPAADKTNYQYLREIHASKRNEFAALVLNYQYVWYGKAPIGREQYASIENAFMAFNNKI